MATDSSSEESCESVIDLFDIPSQNDIEDPSWQKNRDELIEDIRAFYHDHSRKKVSPALKAVPYGTPNPPGFEDGDDRFAASRVTRIFVCDGCGHSVKWDYKTDWRTGKRVSFLCGSWEDNTWQSTVPMKFARRAHELGLINAVWHCNRGCNADHKQIRRQQKKYRKWRHSKDLVLASFLQWCRGDIGANRKKAWRKQRQVWPWWVDLPCGLRRVETVKSNTDRWVDNHFLYKGLSFSKRTERNSDSFPSHRRSASCRGQTCRKKESKTHEKVSNDREK